MTTETLPAEPGIAGTLDVLYQSDNNFVAPLMVSLLSLLENNRQLAHLGIYLIDDGISAANREHIRQLASAHGRQICFLTPGIPAELLKSSGIVQQQKNSYTTFMKIFCCRQLTHLDRILYIDADTIVQGSLAGLCGLDFQGQACAMVASAIAGLVKDYLGTPVYFNAGVIYINLKYWREHDVQAVFLAALQRPDKYRNTLIGDESLINLVLKGQILKLPLKYNCETTWWLWGWNRSLFPRLNWADAHDSPYPLSEIRTAFADPAIIHYLNLTTGRPWEWLNDYPFRKLYRSYLSRLDISKPAPHKSLVLLLKRIAKTFLPFGLRSRIGYRMHESFWRRRIEQEKARS